MCVCVCVLGPSKVSEQLFISHSAHLTYLACTLLSVGAMHMWRQGDASFEPQNPPKITHPGNEAYWAEQNVPASVYPPKVLYFINRENSKTSKTISLFCSNTPPVGCCCPPRRLRRPNRLSVSKPGNNYGCDSCSNNCYSSADRIA